MKIMKKTISICLAVLMLCACGVSAFADNSTVIPIEATNCISSYSGTEKVATFSLSFTLGINYYAGVTTTFNLDGSEELHYSVNWTPASQYIKVALRNVSTNSFYFINISSGSSSGTWDISDNAVPAGTYQVCIINPLDSVGEVSGLAYFYWI